MALTFASSVLIAAKFGAGREMDIYFTAIVIPILVMGILSNALNFTLIPILTEQSLRGEQETNTLLCNLLSAGFLFTSFITLVGMLGATSLVRTITPGFSIEKTAETAHLLRILFPILIFTVMNEIFNSFYYTQKNFFLPSANKIIPPLITIIYIYLFYASLGIASLVFAMLAGSIVQMILLWGGLLKTRRFHYVFLFTLNHPSLRKVAHLITPLIFGMAIYRLTPIFDRFFLSGLPEGNIAHIGYATQLINFIYSLITAAVIIPFFPILAEHAAKKDWEGLRISISKGLKVLLFLSLPCAFLFGLYSQPFIQLLWERNNFSPSDTRAVFDAFAIYSCALPAMVMGALVGQGFYVLQDTKTPVLIGVIETVLYVFLCSFLVPKYQYLGIPISFLIFFTFSIIVCALVLRYKLGNKGGPFFLKDAAKHIISVFIAMSFLSAFFHFSPNSITKMFSVVLSFVCYALVSRFLLKTEEVTYVSNLIYTRLLNRKIPGV